MTRKSAKPVVKLSRARTPKAGGRSRGCPSAIRSTYRTATTRRTSCLCANTKCLKTFRASESLGGL